MCAASAARSVPESAEPLTTPTISSLSSAALSNVSRKSAGACWLVPGSASPPSRRAWNSAHTSLLHAVEIEGTTVDGLQSGTGSGAAAFTRHRAERTGVREGGGIHRVVRRRVKVRHSVVLLVDAGYRVVAEAKVQR